MKETNVEMFTAYFSEMYSTAVVIYVSPQCISSGVSYCSYENNYCRNLVKSRPVHGLFIQPVARLHTYPTMFVLEVIFVEKKVRKIVSYF